MRTAARYVIVGIDPGTTIGIAIISLKGDLIFLGSFKNLEFSELVKLIWTFGHPIVLATDIPIKSKIIYDLVKYLNIKLYYPNRKYHVEEKKKVVKEFIPRLERKHLNSHERDALFAAIKAYRHFSSKIRNVEKRLRNLGIRPSEEILAEVIKGKKLVEILNERKLLY